MTNMKNEEIKENLLELNMTNKMIEDLYHNFSAMKNISDSASWILYCLKLVNRPLTQCELSSMMYLAKQTINSSLQNLISQGYIELKSSDSKKSKLIYLTLKGIELASEVADSMIAAEINALLSFTDEKRNEFLKLYKEYGNYLKIQFEKIMK